MRKVIALAALALFRVTASAQKKAATVKQQPKKETAAPAAQNVVDFVVEYKPASTYVQAMDIDMTMGGSKDGEDGGEPFTQELDMAITYKIKTGALKNGGVPFIAEMAIESPMLESVADQFKDIRFYGRFVKGDPAVDSVTLGGKANKELGEAMQDAFSKALNQFPVTPVKVKVGESFKSRNLPMDLPGVTLENVDTSITYTLKKIEGGNAYFDLLLDTPLNAETNGMAMQGVMKMTGSMVYNISQKYVSGQDIDLDASFIIGDGDMKMTMNMKGKNKHTITVSAN